MIIYNIPLKGILALFIFMYISMTDCNTDYRMTSNNVMKVNCICKFIQQTGTPLCLKMYDVSLYIERTTLN